MTQMTFIDADELAGKIHVLKYDLHHDLKFHVERILEKKNEVRDEWKKEMIQKWADDLEYAYKLMLSRTDYYFEKWMDKQDIEKIPLSEELFNKYKEEAKQ